MPKQSGYSLIELLIVIAIMAIITAALIPSLYSLSNEKDLQVESEKLLTKLQSQRAASIQGVERTWYGVTFDPRSPQPVITFYNPTNPLECDITKRDITSPPCTLESETYQVKPTVAWQLAATTIDLLGNVTPSPLTTPLDVRFNRAQNSYQVFLVKNNTENTPLLRRIRITLTSGGKSSVIAIDGGNICTEESYSISPQPCESVYQAGGIRYYSGPKEGRIFLVN